MSISPKFEFSDDVYKEKALHQALYDSYDCWKLILNTFMHFLFIKGWQKDVLRNEKKTHPSPNLLPETYEEAKKMTLKKCA